MSKFRLRLISDFNAEPLARYLTNAGGKNVVVEVAPYGHVYQALQNTPADEPFWGSIVWTQPERTLPTFSKALDFEEVSFQECLGEVDGFADAVLAYAADQSQVFVMSWALSVEQRGYGLLDWRPGLGLANLVSQMNLHLAQRLAEAGNIYFLNTERWLQGNPPFPQKMWYAAKVPYANLVFEKAANDLLAGIRAITGRSKKLIIVDLDQTLWGGVIGETGWEGIRLGGHDHVGEAFRDFQRALKALTHRGIQLAIVSKNDEAVALEAFDQHPEMLLRRNHFSGWRINWQDKAANVEDLVKELNLGLDAVVFIDDNPAERERVRTAFPEMLVPEWPIDPTAYVTALKRLDCFDTAALSGEDRNRTGMYVAERERRSIKNIAASNDDWLQKLNTHLTVVPVSKTNIGRVAQLFNKTNQLNLSTRRMNENEVLEWGGQLGHVLLAISASDCFGDMGLVGVIGIVVEETTAYLIDFILSCRVMGRKVEETMIHLAVEESLKLNATEMQARYLPTARNRPTLDVFRSLGFSQSEGHLFRSDLAAGFPKPDAVTVILAQEQAA